jgi:predicted nucleic acid-binding protein
MKKRHILVDTDILIETARGDRDALNCLKQLEDHAAIAVSSRSKMELIIACHNKNEFQALERFLNQFRFVQVNEAISDIATELLNQYRISHGLLIADALIAATALSLSLHFISKDNKNYSFIKGLKILPYPHPFQGQEKKTPNTAPEQP